MKDTEQLNNIRMYLIDHIFMNDNVVFSEDITKNKMLEIIASLYELAHITITGEKYDYFWHYYNKVSGGIFETNFFDERGNHNEY